jgi:hypothetical protein
MKIGISSIGYESKELIEQCFVSWDKIKKDSTLIPEITDLKICFSHGCFEETAALGFPIYSTDGTYELIQEQKLNGIIDDLIIYDTPQKEYEMWTNNFKLLKEKYSIDLLIMVNVDEIWSVEDIKKLIKFITNNNLVDYFKINFKNYCIDYTTWVDDFIVPRVWFVNKNGGLKRNYQDDLMEYEDGKKDIQCSHLIIPKNLIFPKHYSWVGSKEYLQRKLKFQSLRYGMCSYAWDEEINKLKLNDEFYLKFNITEPILNKD